MIVHTYEQIEQLREAVTANADISYRKLKEAADTMCARDLFVAIKFEKMGVDPISGKALNLIEQINQMYSNLVVIAAAQDLIDCFPDKSFDLQLGATTGFDIQSIDGQILAECFAVVGVASNDKLNRDCKKLMKTKAPHKFVYFYSHGDSDTMLKNRYHKYPEIQFRRICSF